MIRGRKSHKSLSARSSSNRIRREIKVLSSNSEDYVEFVCGSKCGMARILIPYIIPENATPISGLIMLNGVINNGDSTQMSQTKMLKVPLKSREITDFIKINVQRVDMARNLKNDDPRHKVVGERYTNIVNHLAFLGKMLF